MKNLLLAFLLSVTSSFCFSQTGRFNVLSEFDLNTSYDIIEIPGGYITTGIGIGSNTSVCWVTKTDQNFNIVWSGKFNLHLETQANSRNASMALLNNGNVCILAKSADLTENQTYVNLIVINQDGILQWGKEWIYPGSDVHLDLNNMTVDEEGNILIDHSVRNILGHLKLTTEGLVITSKYTQIPNYQYSPGGSSIECSDGGKLLIIYDDSDSSSVIIKLNNQFNVEWSKKISYLQQGDVSMKTAYQYNDGSFLIFGAISNNDPATVNNFPGKVFSVMKLTSSGELTELKTFLSPTNMGFSEIYPAAENEFIFSSTEGEIGTINLNTDQVLMDKLDITQANHGFQHLHKFSDKWVMTGMGPNWQGTKIISFQNIGDHSCLESWFTSILDAHTVPLENLQATNPTVFIGDLDTGTVFQPQLLPVEISFAAECYLETEDLGKELTLELYPNPISAGELITIKANPNISLQSQAVKISDMQGNLVALKLAELDNDLIKFETGNLAPGMYFVQLEIKETTKAFRLVIQ